MQFWWTTKLTHFLSQRLYLLALTDSWNFLVTTESFLIFLIQYFLQLRRRTPLLTAPPEDLGTQQTVSQNPVVYHDLPSATRSTEFLGFSSKTKPMAIMEEGEIASLQGETSQRDEANVKNFCKERQNTMVCTSRSSCRRVGLRKVGMGCSRDLANAMCMSHSGPQFRQKSSGYRPPAAPEFMSNSSSGDVSIALLYIYNQSPISSFSKKKIFFCKPLQKNSSLFQWTFFFSSDTRRRLSWARRSNQITISQTK